jgi:hypothetical protein
MTRRFFVGALFGLSLAFRAVPGEAEELAVVYLRIDGMT